MLIEAAAELNMFWSFLAESKRVNLLNSIAFLHFGTRSYLRLLHLDEMELAKVSGATDRDLLAASFDFCRIFLHKLSLDEQEETEKGGCIRWLVAQELGAWRRL